MICSYCGTENENNFEKCHFCEADLYVKRLTEKPYPSQEEAEQSLPILQTYHTYDLLLFLRYLREERSKAYHLMRGVQKASQDVLENADVIEFGETRYRYYTKRMKVIEGILIDRIGYKPKRVDDKLLTSLKAKMMEG